MESEGEVKHVCHFEPKFFTSPTWCAFCGSFIWFNLSAPVAGFQCEGCGAPTHTYCASLINATLTKSEKENFELVEESTENESHAVECAHSFSNAFLKFPTWCYHCGTFILGITESQQNASICSGCQIVVHNGCKSELGGKQAALSRSEARGHKIVSVVFKYPTFCNQCSQFIWNPIGWKCKNCGVAIHHSCKAEAEADTCLGAMPYSDHTVLKLKSVPTRYLSQLWGNATKRQFSKSIQTQLNLLYAHSTGCNLLEAEHDVSYYQSLSHFFMRNLKGGVRIVDDTALLASPVDGKILNFGTIDSDSKIEQVKGVDIDLVEFLGKDSVFFKSFETQIAKATKFYYCVIYLAPGDYHGVHSPCDWKIGHCQHFPGHLFPVNSWATSSIPNLLAINERVVLSGTWTHGYFSYILVGAYNVGSIELKWEKDLQTNAKDHTPSSPRQLLNYEKSIELTQGEQMGFFNLGSTVVLVFEAPADAAFVVTKGNVIKLGNALFNGTT